MWQNDNRYKDNRYIGRRTYPPPLQFFPAGMSTIDKIKSIAPRLLALFVIVFFTFKATNSWLKTIILSLLYGFILKVKVLFGNDYDINESENGTDHFS